MAEKKEIKRPKPTQKFAIQQDEATGNYISVSIESYPYMETDGYDTIITRQMHITLEKLKQELEKLKEDLAQAPEVLRNEKKELTKMQKDLKVIKYEGFKQVVHKAYTDKLNNYNMMKLNLEQDKKTLKHYEKLHDKMTQ